MSRKHLAQSWTQERLTLLNGKAPQNQLLDNDFQWIPHEVGKQPEF